MGLGCVCVVVGYQLMPTGLVILWLRGSREACVTGEDIEMTGSQSGAVESYESSLARMSRDNRQPLILISHLSEYVVGMASWISAAANRPG